MAYPLRRWRADLDPIHVAGPRGFSGRELVQSARCRWRLRCGKAARHGSSSTAEILSFSSDDRGRTWRLDSAEPVERTSPGSRLLGIRQPSRGAAHRGGYDRLHADRLRATYDGGKTWTSYQTQTLPGHNPGRVGLGGRRLGPRRYSTPSAVTGRGHSLYASHDRGKTWTRLLGPPASSASYSPQANPASRASPFRREALPQRSDRFQVGPGGWRGGLGRCPRKRARAAPPSV